MLIQGERFDFEGFDWDGGNQSKNWKKHRVEKTEAEQIFYRLPLLVSPDRAHSDQEQRFFCLGRTARDRFLFIAFTIRNKKISVISARDQSKKEREVYVKQLKTTA